MNTFLSHLIFSIMNSWPFLKDLTQKIIQLNKYEDAIYAMKRSKTFAENANASTNKMWVEPFFESFCDFEPEYEVNFIQKWPDRVGLDLAGRSEQAFEHPYRGF